MKYLEYSETPHPMKKSKQMMTVGDVAVAVIVAVVVQTSSFAKSMSFAPAKKVVENQQEKMGSCSSS